MLGEFGRRGLPSLRLALDLAMSLLVRLREELGGELGKPRRRGGLVLRLALWGHMVPKLTELMVTSHYNNPFSVEYSEVLIVQPIRDRNPDFVPALVAHFIITEEQDRHPALVKGVEDSARDGRDAVPVVPGEGHGAKVVIPVLYG